ncbi:spore cortex biosynthesis protein YabQ [uncultured Clostridium sp.]|uniref:spore cortex biosynthesis protein YabQ n=1 Tax=uncultured Clostridium sp. TaxID=59620 RepID=UPI0026026D47|nr:spore cortex biosynthesis protein YabQ [uncultured Clostridium sp.]
MPLTTQAQINIVFYSIVAGGLLGMLFDVYRIIRGKDVNKVIEVIEDVLFWILSAITIFVFLLYNNFAFMGPYVYLFIGSGLIIYLKLLSKFIYKMECLILNGLSKGMRILCKRVSYPIRLIYSKTNHKE